MTDEQPVDKKLKAPKKATIVGPKSGAGLMVAVAEALATQAVVTTSAVTLDVVDTPGPAEEDPAVNIMLYRSAGLGRIVHEPYTVPASHPLAIKLEERRTFALTVFVTDPAHPQHVIGVMSGLPRSMSWETFSQAIPLGQSDLPAEWAASIPSLRIGQSRAQGSRNAISFAAWAIANAWVNRPDA